MSAQGAGFLLKEDRGAVRILKLNRPEVRNALNDELRDALSAEVRAAVADPTVRAIVLTGEGPKAFSAGADIRALLQRTPRRMLDMFQGDRIDFVLERCPKPIVAAINGYAFGGGFEVALACPIRIASENASVGLPEVNLGIFPALGGTQRLPRLIGVGRALEMILSARILTAKEALEFGIVSKVVPPDRLLDEAVALAETIASKGPVAVRLAKDAILTGFGMTLEEGLRYENRLAAVAMGTKDKEEGLTAFLEKRKPVFTGE
ncbi:MAG: enoyl-CoA hydratase/isomerase family protein [Deltaproteobacteria bacterium]|nr:enoyl-CoA hydratase-related protein [Candidatus Deferrimicrobiaceae bacterium]